MKVFRNREGFTLIEVIIAVALVSILASAITLPMVRNIKNGKITRAQNDVQTIGTALISFYRDVGEWPTSGGAVDRLVGNSSLGGGNNGIPAGVPDVSGSSRWQNFGQPGALTEHLIRNRTAGGAGLYTVSRNPINSAGWNGPYLGEVNLDPWGNPYLVNIRYARPPKSGTVSENFDMHNILVVSTGPNRRCETSFDDGIYDEMAGGDDIAFIVERARRF